VLAAGLENTRALSIGTGLAIGVAAGVDGVDGVAGVAGVVAAETPVG
jgi:hypothetical protein